MRADRFTEGWPLWAAPLAKTVICDGKATRRGNTSGGMTGENPSSGKMFMRNRDMALLDALPPCVRHAVNYASWPILAVTAFDLGIKHSIAPADMARKILDYSEGITPGSPSLVEFEAAWPPPHPLDIGGQ